MTSPQTISIEGYRVFEKTGSVFPLVLSPPQDESNFDICHWLEANRPELDRLLLQHRSILFRGFVGLNGPNDFQRFVEASGFQAMPYLGGAAVRTQLTERVFTANESPPSERIPFHHELAQTPDPPTHLMFFCEVPPTEGGETPLLISNEIYERIRDLHPAAMGKIESQGVKYIRIMPKEDDPTSAIGRGWQSTFLCQTKEEAEQALQQLGSTWEWLEGENLKTVTAVIPAVKHDTGSQRTNSTSFFNSLVAAYTGWNDSRNKGEHAVVTADGEYLSPAFMADAQRIMEEIAVAVPWQRGDIMLIDNRTVMHSRRTFQGSRRILAALGRDPDR